jgi:hypothetical protein
MSSASASKARSPPVGGSAMADRNRKSLSTQALTPAPMRAAWFSSTDAMVSASAVATAERKP